MLVKFQFNGYMSPYQGIQSIQECGEILLFIYWVQVACGSLLGMNRAVTWWVEMAGSMLMTVIKLSGKILQNIKEQHSAFAGCSRVG